jgi:hypothetical protein
MLQVHSGTTKPMKSINLEDSFVTQEMAICAGPYFNGLWKPAKYGGFPSFKIHILEMYVLSAIFLGVTLSPPKKNAMFR